MLLLSACSTPTPVQQTANGQPIMPLRMTGDTACVVLTDYVPRLSAQSALRQGDAATQTATPKERSTIQNASGTNGHAEWWLEATDGHLGTIDSRALPDTIWIVNPQQALTRLTISDGTHTLAIPVLPDKPVRQGLVSTAYKDGVLTLRFLTEPQQPDIQAYIQNLPIEPSLIQKQADGSYTLALAESEGVRQCSKGRSFLRIYAADKDCLYNDLLLPLENGQPIRSTDQLTRHDDQAQVLYSVLIDRFYDGNKANDWKLHSPEVLDIVDYQGGDLSGIKAKIEAGYFDSLGINTLWISPITQNPWDAWGKYPFRHGNKYDSTKTYTRFSGYHGYWPILITAIDRRLGSDEELRDLLATAHRHDINVVLDYVANHAHINAAVYQQHPDWHTDSILPDGRRNFELWDEARLTTWFDAHIPTLDLERQEVCEAMTDSALYWLSHYDLDGFRHDACKHIPEGYWRMFGQKIATRFPYRHIWMIGETYGSPELIGSYVKTGMLNAQFDFNLYFSAIHALCGEGSMADIERTIRTSLSAYGAHHTMGNISGNHDQVRFASFAGGAVRFDEDPKEAGWTRTCGLLPNDLSHLTAEERAKAEDDAYRRTLLLEVLNLTIPGVPCIYQGDEYAEVGANDPDNRHKVRFDGLNAHEEAFRRTVSELIHLRRHSLPLLYGDYIPVEASHDRLVFDRVYIGESVRVTIDRKQLTYSIEQR